MTANEPPFTVGVEEEYYLVDAETGDLVPEAPEGLLAECEARLPGQVSPEFLQTQIEVGTRVCGSMAEVRAELVRLRREISAAAAGRGLAIVAASTHPFGVWRRQRPTRRPRYGEIAEEYRAPARRLLICGMHVHIGVEPDELRIDLMNQFSYFLPHLLALTASSPFWEGEDTGLASYRLTVWDAMPRTGLPPRLDGWREYEALVAALIAAEAIEDATKLWWDVRPSARFPTLEARIFDCCARVDDAVCVAALTRCVMRMLWRLRRRNMRFRIYPAALVAENRWRAMRHGMDRGLIDFGERRVKPMAALVDELLDMIAEDAEALDCRAEVAHAREIVRGGSSARRQRAEWARAGGGEEAGRSVVRMLMRETLRGVADPPGDPGRALPGGAGGAM